MCQLHGPYRKPSKLTDLQADTLLALAIIVFGVAVGLVLR